VNLFSSRVFEAAVDTSVISIKNMKHGIETFQVFRDLDSKTLELNQDIFLKMPVVLFAVNLTTQSKPIIDKLLNGQFCHLEKIIEVQQGIIYSGQPKEKVFANEEKDKRYKRVLDGRDILKWKINWYSKIESKYICYSEKLHRPRAERLFLAKEKLLLPRKSTRIACTYDNDQFYALNTAYICLLKDIHFDIKYILACLNSSLINYFYSSLFFGWQVTIPALNSIPIKNIPADKQKPFITLVDQILAITKDDDYLDNPQKQSKVKALEAKIDQLVYKLYGLTPEEIKIVEGEK